MASVLRARQQKFVEQYAKDGNGTRAARAAGYSHAGAHDRAHRLLQRPDIQAAIAVARAQQNERLRIEADDFIQELAALCLADVTQAFDASGRMKPFADWPRALRRALAGFDVVIPRLARDQHPHVVQKLRFHDKTKALELMGKHLALFIDRREVGRPGQFASLTDDELAAKIRAAADQVAERAVRRATDVTPGEKR